MRCSNQGADYSTEDIQWSCVANLPEEVKLGSTDVICEGYKDRDDEFVLKGSCGVEYRLLLTDKGEERYGGGGFWNGKGNSGGEESNFPAWLFMIVFFGVFGWILYSMYQAYQTGPNVRRQPRRFGGGGWGGWGGGNDDDDPPPPYPGYPRSKPTFGAPGWQPGFWSGVAGGAAAGYMAGNRGNRQPDPVQRPGSWFGGDNGGSSRTRSSGSNSGSGARHESTGFGSTSRR
jgi:hypothetical protein